MPLHVAIYHDALVPPVGYGGTERVLAWLGRGLLARGHRVTLIARAGSGIPGAAFVEARPGVPLAGAQVPSDVDLIHLHATPAGAFQRPLVVTIHGNGKPGEHYHPCSIFVSRKHAENHGSRHFVHNGIDPDEYPWDRVRRSHLAFLAKASWRVKNLAGAIQVARAAGRPLEVMGNRALPFGLQQFVPALGGVRYRGMVGDDEKKAILRDAAALVFPVRWPEPFGLAPLEALACGCPVLGTPYGALPEIVTEKTGLLSASASALVEALRTREFIPEECRRRVTENFTHLHMTDGYLKYYERVLATGRLGDAAEPEPRALFVEPAETLLPWA